MEAFAKNYQKDTIVQQDHVFCDPNSPSIQCISNRFEKLLLEPDNCFLVESFHISERTDIFTICEEFERCKSPITVDESLTIDPSDDEWFNDLCVFDPSPNIYYGKSLLGIKECAESLNSVPLCEEALVHFDEQWFDLDDHWSLSRTRSTLLMDDSSSVIVHTDSCDCMGCNNTSTDEDDSFFSFFSSNSHILGDEENGATTFLKGKTRLVAPGAPVKAPKIVYEARNHSMKAAQKAKRDLKRQLNYIASRSSWGCQRKTGRPQSAGIATAAAVTGHLQFPQMQF